MTKAILAHHLVHPSNTLTVVAEVPELFCVCDWFLTGPQDFDRTDCGLKLKLAEFKSNEPPLSVGLKCVMYAILPQKTYINGLNHTFLFEGP